MIDVTSLSSLVDALRAETAKDSISPESLGAILQKILDLLATAAPSSDVTALQSWKTTITKAISDEASTRQKVDNTLSKSIKQEVSDREAAIEKEARSREVHDESLGIMITNAKSNLQGQIDAIKTTASAKPFYHRQCDSIDDVLTMKGAAFLVSQGYTPLLFRYTVRQGRNGHKLGEDGRRCYQRLRRGWHLCGDANTLHISSNKIEFYDDSARKHTTDPKALFGNLHDIYDSDGKLSEVRVGFGKRTYNVIGHRRFRFAIAFAKNPVFNEPFDFNTLITNLAEFRVHVSAPNGAEKADFVFSI